MKDQMKNEGHQPAPRTLRELGVPGSLATEMEAALKALGRTDGDRITGFAFVTPEGARHELRLEAADQDQAPGRAA